MAYFHCLIGGGSSGGGYTLTVTCDPDFAGTTITCTDGVTTLTSTCPSASPYEVEFDIPNGGAWTVSGIVSGSTCTASIDIPDELELIAIPNGSTATPTDVIQTWLKCGGIFDKSYTTLNEVLADSTTLLALISDNNASDYLVRSTTWASGITADSTAMTDIGANDYCADTLLANSTWLTAICNSIYFENVLNVKVPTMTSDTSPSGQVIYASQYNNTTMAGWKAFDGDNTNNSMHLTVVNYPISSYYLGYVFSDRLKAKKVVIYAMSYHASYYYNVAIYGGNSLDNLTKLSSDIQIKGTSIAKYEAELNNNDTYTTYVIKIENSNAASAHVSGVAAMETAGLQVYGRYAST